MKKFMFLAVLVSLVFGEEIFELQVKNMGCSSCAKKIEKAASSVAGFKSMSYDTKTKDVNITMQDGSDINAVIDAIKKSKDNAELKK